MKLTLLASAVAVASLAALSSAQAAFVSVDDFESYSVASYSGGSTAFVANGGPWQSNIGGPTGLVSIKENDPNTPSANKYLAHGWNVGFRGANRTVPTIADGDSATYYFQIRTEDPTPDVSYGLSDDATGALGSFGNFEAQVALTTDPNGVPRLGARNGGSFELDLVTGLSADTWYDIWIVADNAADTYDVYLGTSGDPDVLGTKVASNFGFRNGAASNDLVTFMTLSNNHGDNQANLDNIYYNPNAIPEPGTLALLALGSLCIAGRRRK